MRLLHTKLHEHDYPFDRSLFSEPEALDYYIDAIRCRNTHKDESVEIALHVFRRTNPKGMLSFPVSEAFKRLRYEFAALEAPGWSEDETKSLEESQDEAWDFALGLIRKAKKKGTV
jgi:hypothetical protein